MFTGEAGSGGMSGYAIDFPEPLASIIHGYKSAIQQLQLEIFKYDLENLKEIGHCFEKLEASIGTLIKSCTKKH
jgi:hypothetical protein